MDTASENISAESYYENNIEEDESDSDPDYYPSRYGFESGNFHPESLEETIKTRPISLVLPDSASTGMFYLSVPSYYRKKFC